MYLIFFLLISSFSWAQTPDLKKLSESQKWHRLLHFRKSILGMGPMKSEADGSEFFLAKNGKYDAYAEIKKAYEAFSTETHPTDNHPICRFPARFKWLNHQFGDAWKVDWQGCQTYLAFFSKMAARRASIVFSSYYLSNPNSAFGHTFMRLSRYDDSSETEMLDYGINYAAESKGSDPFTYVFKGLLGGFKGRFAAIPFYYKVREYSNAEFRDLWSYELKMDINQVFEMVDHIWELGHTHFDYFYFLENCSYHLLSLIEVVMPENYLTKLYHLFTIPADTVRLLQVEGIIGPGKRRESTYSKLIRISKDLDQESLKAAKKMAMQPDKAPSLVEGREVKNAANVLDVGIEAFDYYHADKILADDLKTKELKAPLLRARASNPVITSDDPKEDSLQHASPALSHSPTRLGLYEGYEHLRGKQTRLELRSSFHDMLDPIPGSMLDSQLEMANMSFVYREKKYQDGKFLLDRFSILNVRNFPEQNFWASPLSWEVDAGAAQLKRLGCTDCPEAYLIGSIGNTLKLNQGRFLLSLLMNAELNLQNFYQDHYRLGLGPKFFTRYIFNEKWLMSLESGYQFNTYRPDAFFRDHQLLSLGELRFHQNPQISWSLKGSGFEMDHKWMSKGELGLQYFY